jgi:hypothetical protein
MSEPGATAPGFQNDIVKVLAVKGQANAQTSKQGHCAFFTYYSFRYKDFEWPYHPCNAR